MIISIGRPTDMLTGTIISARKRAYRTLTSDIDKYVQLVEAVERKRNREEFKIDDEYSCRYTASKYSGRYTTGWVSEEQPKEVLSCHCESFQKAKDVAFDELKNIDMLDKSKRNGREYDKLRSGLVSIGAQFYDYRKSDNPWPQHECCEHYCRDIEDVDIVQRLELVLRVHHNSEVWPFTGFCLSCYEANARPPDKWRKWVVLKGLERNRGCECW